MTTTETASMLVLSTAYITETTCNVYLPRRPVAYDKAGYGWFVGTHLDGCDDDPADLALVLAFARGGGHAWVMFDADGPKDCDALPTHDWETPAAETFRHSPETCPSRHWNRGDDICADCGTHLG